MLLRTEYDGPAWLLMRQEITVSFGLHQAYLVDASTVGKAE